MDKDEQKLDEPLLENTNDTLPKINLGKEEKEDIGSDADNDGDIDFDSHGDSNTDSLKDLSPSFREAKWYAYVGWLPTVIVFLLAIPVALVDALARASGAVFGILYGFLGASLFTAGVATGLIVPAAIGFIAISLISLSIGGRSVRRLFAFELAVFFCPCWLKTGLKSLADELGSIKKEFNHYFYDPHKSAIDAFCNALLRLLGFIGATLKAFSNTLVLIPVFVTGGLFFMGPLGWVPLVVFVLIPLLFLYFIRDWFLLGASPTCKYMEGIPKKLAKEGIDARDQWQKERHAGSAIVKGLKPNRWGFYNQRESFPVAWWSFVHWIKRYVFPLTITILGCSARALSYVIVIHKVFALFSLGGIAIPLCGLFFIAIYAVELSVDGSALLKLFSSRFRIWSIDSEVYFKFKQSQLSFLDILKTIKNKKGFMRCAWAVLLAVSCSLGKGLRTWLSIKVMLGIAVSLLSLSLSPAAIMAISIIGGAAVAFTCFSKKGRLYILMFVPSVFKEAEREAKEIEKTEKYEKKYYDKYGKECSNIRQEAKGLEDFNVDRLFPYGFWKLAGDAFFYMKPSGKDAKNDAKKA